MKVLFIDIDTLRPDHMGCYGYYRNTTPNMDRVAEEGIRFDRYYCSDAPCLPSRAALVSGMFGIRNGAVGHGGTAGDRRLTGIDRSFHDQVDDFNFHNIFRRAGMYTASVSSFAERHSSFWFNAGFNECINVGDGGMESGEKVLPEALSWLERNEHREDWFLHVHFWDPHTPYRAPESFGNPFEDSPLETWITEDTLQKHVGMTGPHTIQDLSMYDDVENPKYPRMPGSAFDMDGLKRVFDGYDCGIRYCDSLVGQILDLLKKQGIYEETAIIITSDHGENMGEMGVYCEHGTADHATCHIPMIIKWPGGPKGLVEDSFHYNLDLVPTMADMMNVAHSDNWDGESYAPVIKDGKSVGRDSLVISQMAHVCQRSAIFDHYLYVRTIHDGYHLFPDEMLYDIAADPYEEHDLMTERPDLADRGARILLNWNEAEMKKSQYTVDPMWTVMKENGPFHTWGALENYIERLKKTGREDGAKALEEKYMK